MKYRKGGKIQALKCDKCNRVFISGNGIDGLPNGVGFQQQDGNIITLCKACIMEIGKLKEAGDEAGLKSFWNELGVEVEREG